MRLTLDTRSDFRCAMLPTVWHPAYVCVRVSTSRHRRVDQQYHHLRSAAGAKGTGWRVCPGLPVRLREQRAGLATVCGRPDRVETGWVERASVGKLGGKRLKRKDLNSISTMLIYLVRRWLPCRGIHRGAAANATPHKTSNMSRMLLVSMKGTAAPESRRHYS